MGRRSAEFAAAPCLPGCWAARHLPGADQVRWLDRLAEDHANLHAAVAWSGEAGEVRLAQRLSAALWRYWQLDGHLREGRALADAVLDMPGGDEPTLARIYAVAAAAGMAYWQGERDRANRLYRLQLDLARRIGDPAAEADASFSLAATEWIGGDASAARTLLERARELYDAVGDEVGSARTEWGRSNILMETGTSAEVAAVLVAARRRYRANNDAMYLALSAGDFAFLCARLGERVAAFRWGLQSLTGYHALRDVATTTLTLAALAVGAVDVDRPDVAATLLGAYETNCEVHGVRPPVGLERMVARSRPLERASEVLPPEVFQAAFERRRGMSLDDVVAFAVESAREVLGDDIGPPEEEAAAGPPPA